MHVPYMYDIYAIIQTDEVRPMDALLLLVIEGFTTRRP